MSVIYCHDCDRHYDEDFHLECPGCETTQEQREIGATAPETKFPRELEEQAWGLMRRSRDAAYSPPPTTTPMEGDRGMGEEKNGSSGAESARTGTLPVLTDTLHCAGDCGLYPEVGEPLRHHLQFISAALSTYDGGPAGADVQAAWRAITSSVRAAVALNDACDALWNDSAKIVRGHINDQHVWAITHAQRGLRDGLAAARAKAEGKS